MNPKIQDRIIMIGPDPEALGGISRVVRIWRDNRFFDAFNIIYLNTVSDHANCKWTYLLKSFLRFIMSIMLGIRNVYVHTSSYNSFRRKMPFLFVSILFYRKITLHIHPTHFYNYICDLKGIEKKIVFYILKRVKSLVVLTEDMKCKLKLLLPLAIVFVLPNAVDIRRMRSPVQPDRHNDRLLYLGWYIKEKGIYEIIDSLEMLKNEGFVYGMDFCGTKEIKKFKKYVKRKGLDDQVTVNGWVDGPKKIELIEKCTALVLPSHSEGMPNVILEAMATQTPIIATHVGGLREILKNAENAIIAEVGDVNDLRDKIKLCMESKDLREKIAKNAYRDAVSNYDVTVVFNKLRRIISNF